MIQVAETLLPIFGQSEDAARPVVVLLAIGFIPALILAWVFEWTPQGIRREADVNAESSRASTKGFDRAMFELAKVISTIGNDSAEARNAVRPVVDRMAAVAPDSSYINTWQGWIAAYWDNDLQAAATHFERAIANDPLTPVSMRRAVSGFLGKIGRGEEGYALAKYSAMRDPASTRWASIAALMARRIGRSNEAAEHLEAVLEWQTPTALVRWNLGAAYREANAESWESIARVLAWIGQNDGAFEYLEKMVEQNGPVSASNIKSDLYSRLSADPRYDAFLVKHGVSDEDLSHIRFDPPYPPAMRAELERIMESLETAS